MPKFITTEDLAKRVGCSARYIRFLAAKGRIPGATRVNAKQWIIEDSARLVDVLKPVKRK